MWITFWPDVLVGVFVAGLTASFGWVLFRMERKRNERAAMRRLIGELARRRAFVFSADDVRPVDIEPDDHDFKSVSKSIIDVRAAVDEARVASREKSKVHRSLNQMTVDCNIFLEDSQNERWNYMVHLARLRDALTNRISDLQRVHRKLVLLPPGSSAFSLE